MNDTTDRPDPAAHGGTGLQATPAIDTLLEGLERRLRRGVWLHGLGTTAAVGAGWLLWAFLADWVLRVPGPVRVVHAIGFVVLAAWILRRELLQPLARIPDASGLALLIERQHPELHELLVSAVQLRNSSDRAVSPALVESVVREAEVRARGLAPEDALAPEGPRRRSQLGAAAAVLLLVLGLAFPVHAGTFLARALGGGPGWPQRTHLAVEIPDLGEGWEVEKSADRIHVRVARGTDVPVVVRAEGVVPDEVVLRFDAGRDLALNPTGAGTFRTLLRSLQDDVGFHVIGGDDRDGLPVVSVEVLNPPDVEGLAIAVEPPEYTGLPEELSFDRDVEVLAGSRVIVTAHPSPEDATGVARLSPEERTIELLAMPFPADPASADEPSAPSVGLGFELWADRSLGFRIELTDDKGLTNPDPGLFRVQVVEDQAPEVQVLEPTRGEIEVVLGGALPLRARVSDDFGLTGAGWKISQASGSEGELQQGAFALVPVQLEESSARSREAALAAVRLEVDQLAGVDGTVAPDQRYELEVFARDNRAPEANEGRSFALRIRVVTPEELLRRMQDRLGQARMSALRLYDLQDEKRARAGELFAALDAPDAEVESRALSTAIAGQRRVVADARALAQELAGVAADVLYARIEEKADRVMEAYDARVSRLADARFRPDVWRDLADDLEAGRLADAGFAGKLVTLVDLALEISEIDAPAATEHLADSERALDVEAAAEALGLAVERQAQTLRRIEALVDELAQWNNFQNVLQLTRDILNRQKSLRERTESIAKENDR